MFPRGQTPQVEWGPREFYGYRFNSRIERSYRFISDMLGPISSFTGTYWANTWIVNLDRRLSSRNIEYKSLQLCMYVTGMQKYNILIQYIYKL